MRRDEIDMNENFSDLSVENINLFIDNMLPIDSTSESDENFNVNLEASIDETIEHLEKILKLEALSDNELAELYATEAELQEDITILDFDDEY